MLPNDNAFQQFIHLCFTKKEMSLTLSTGLFDLFFTHEEKKDLATRYLIIKMLLNNEKTQRQIAKELNVSISKITRGSNELKRMDSALLDYLREVL